MADQEYTVRITADGSAFVTGVRASEAQLERMRRAIQGTVGEAERASQSTDRFGASLISIRQLAGTVAGALGVMGLAETAQWMVQTLTETERLRGALQTATGSIEGAAQAFTTLESFASETPFALEQSVEAFIRLKNLGLDPSEEAIRSYGNTAAAMGTDLNQMIEAVADATTFEFERLKEFGIRASQEGERVTFTFQGVETEVAKNAEAIEGYLRDLGDTKFGDAMSDQMERLPGLFSNLGDEVSNLVRAMGDAGLTAVIGNTVRGMITLTQETRKLMEHLGLAARTAEDQLGFALENNDRRAQALRDTLAILEQAGNGNTAAAEDLRQKLAALEGQSESLQGELEELSNASLGTVKAFDSHVEAFEAYQKAQAEAAEEAEKSAEKLAKAQEKAAETLADLKDEFSGIDPETKRYRDNIEKIEAAAQTLNLTQEETNRYLEEARKHYERSLGPMKDYADTVRKIGEGMDTVSQNIPQTSGSIADLEQQLRDLERGTETIATESVPEVQRTMESLGSRIVDVFDDTFENVYQNGIDSFSDLGRDIFNVFMSILARFTSMSLASAIGIPGAEDPLGGQSFGQALQGFGGAGLNNFGMQFGFAPDPSFVGPVQPGFTNATLGGTLGAAGLGFAGGRLLNQLIGGNATFGGIGGAAGAAIGNVLLPGVGGFIGGTLGSLVGGLFGNNRPPNRTSAAGLDFSTGAISNQVLDPATQGQLQQIMNPLQQLSQMFRGAGIGFREDLRPLVPDVGERDRIQLGDGVVVDTPEQAVQAIFKRMFDQEWFVDMPDQVRTLLEAFEGTTEQILAFTGTVLTLNQQLPELQAVFGQQSLEALVGAAEGMGGTQAFLGGTQAFADRFGFADDVIEASLGTARNTMEDELAALGTTVEDFEKDFAEARKKSMTPEQIQAWITAGNAIIRVEQLERDLAAARGEVADTAANQEAALRSLGATLNAIGSEAANQGMDRLEFFRTELVSVFEQLREFDGSAESVMRLNNSLLTLQQIQQQISAEVAAARASIGGTVGGAIDQVTLAGLDEQGRYNFFRQRSEADRNRIMTLTDPQQIAQAVESATRNAMQAFALLTPEQQRELGDEFIAYLEGLSEIGDERLEMVDQEVKTGLEKAGDAVVQQLGDAIKPFLDATNKFLKATERLDGAATKMDRSAGRMESAAARQQQAANTPVNVVVEGGNDAVGFS